MKPALISVIVPCYNQAQYLSDALDSVLKQTFTNWECIIVNDGSPDNTDKVAKIFCELDARFKYADKKNGGLSAARNFGISLAIGNYILPLDADDKIGSNYLNDAFLILEKNKNVKIVYCNAVLFGSETGNWILPNYSVEILLKENIIFCSAFFRKSDFTKIIGGYDETMVNGFEDWDMWLTLLKNGGEVVKIDKIHFYYRKKNNSMLTKMSVETKNQIDNYVHLKHAGFLFEVFGNPLNLYNELIYHKSFSNRIKKLFLFKIINKIRVVMNKSNF